MPARTVPLLITNWPLYPELPGFKKFKIPLPILVRLAVPDKVPLRLAAFVGYRNGSGIGHSQRVGEGHRIGSSGRNRGPSAKG